MSLFHPSASIRRDIIAATPRSACPSAWTIPPKAAIAATSLRAVGACDVGGRRKCPPTSPPGGKCTLSVCPSPLSSCLVVTNRPELGHGDGAYHIRLLSTQIRCVSKVCVIRPHDLGAVCACMYAYVCMCAPGPWSGHPHDFGSSPVVSSGTCTGLSSCVIDMVRHCTVRNGTVRTPVSRADVNM